jgi:hypothetical protein
VFDSRVLTQWSLAAMTDSSAWRWGRGGEAGTNLMINRREGGGTGVSTKSSEGGAALAVESG